MKYTILITSLYLFASFVPAVNGSLRNVDLDGVQINGKIKEIKESKYLYEGDSLIFQTGTNVTFDSTGYMSSVEIKFSDSLKNTYSQFSFEEQNGLVNKICLFHDLDKTLERIVDIKYNSTGQIIETQTSGYPGVTFKYEYDGGLMKGYTMSVGHNGHLAKAESKFEYNQREDKISIKTYSDQELISSKSIEYNSRRLPIREVKRKEGKIIRTRTFSYIYDSHDNWVNKIISIDSVESYRINRKLSYY